MRLDPETLRQCWFLAGPTACGKTEVSLRLAERLGAEVIALDSMSLYRGMDVGTAKATPAERTAVPHHLIDVIEPHQEFSVADYVQAAASICNELLARGKVPLFVGGTGLYLRGLLRGVFDGPPADWGLRSRLEARGELHRRLSEVDPVTAARLHPNDQRRIIRALEIYELTGQPASAMQQEQPLPLGERPEHVFWLSPPRAWLYERIDQRVERMIDEGLVAEVARLLSQPAPLSRTARQALGYREIIDHLAGRSTLPEAVARIQTSTRQFAKRQHTWFRNLEECHAIEITGRESAAQIAELLLTAAGDPVPQPPS